MNWAELRQAAASDRIEVQSHSAMLHVFRARKGLTLLPGEDIHDYAELLMGDMNTMDHYAVHESFRLMRSFAYPYGYVEPLAELLLGQYGYQITITSEPHVNRLTRDSDCLYLMGRLLRSGCISTA